MAKLSAHGKAFAVERNVAFNSAMDTGAERTEMVFIAAGDWILETASGPIESVGFATETALTAYSGLLADDFADNPSTLGTISVGGSLQATSKPQTIAIGSQ